MDLLYEHSGDDSQFDNLLTSADSGLDRSSSFHISVAWTLEAPTNADDKFVHVEDSDSLSDIVMEFSSVKIKIGNVVTDATLHQELQA